MTRTQQLNDWIVARKAEGCWVTQCPSCHWWFAQLHKGRVGRRAFICSKHRCLRWNHYQKITGRAPPEWICLKWREEYGDTPRKYGRKRHEEQAVAA